MWNISKEAFVKNRTFMARLKPDLEEFLAIVGIMFWTLGKVSFFTSWFLWFGIDITVIKRTVE